MKFILNLSRYNKTKLKMASNRKKLTYQDNVSLGKIFGSLSLTFEDQEVQNAYKINRILLDLALPCVQKFIEQKIKKDYSKSVHDFLLDEFNNRLNGTHLKDVRKKVEENKNKKRMITIKDFDITSCIKRNKLNIPPLTPENQVQVYEKFNTFLINILRPSNDINNDSNIREIDACRKMVIEDKVPEEICYLSQLFMDDPEYVLIREIRDQLLLLKEQINIRC